MSTNSHCGTGRRIRNHCRRESSGTDGLWRSMREREGEDEEFVIEFYEDDDEAEPSSSPDGCEGCKAAKLVENIGYFFWLRFNHLFDAG